MTNLAPYFDHTTLKPDTTLAQIEQLCSEAKNYGFASVCVPPFFVKKSVQLLKDSKVHVATVIGFPMGYSTTAAKVEEIKRAIDEGAREVDVVVNICAVKSGDWNFVRHDIERMIAATHLKGKVIKVILETGLMADDEIDKLAEICNELGPDYVKTSTGFNGSGANEAIVGRLRSLMNKKIKIKASGGIRDRAAAEAMITAGADRLGSSSSVLIVKDL
ncbi:deoxyribose-phosphate aldolase [Flavilitoribacter nigricans]|uniref:Deoxyribose-phosphate aldolase n=1 Tax=Flavilitoribacter nigricans (strain ATCC 23147 / DSM 23189 / NBRC 102662 / NCIMB 1420 / SS-2) TaxID=1122177 RepID=A0A2D0NAW0_FLAN2|nr:deoxyribose-phosphate aldolase [Flavilitoribacter nigricans]PHN05617.1 deoxyribose-phosphate aldolase [Flavilitoribacter nigricans DSM 23189 = NBRC 102662]